MAYIARFIGKAAGAPNIPGGDTIAGFTGRVPKRSPLVANVYDGADRVSIEGGARPYNMRYRMNNSQAGYWYQYALMDAMFGEISILAAMVLRPPQEILRHGIEWAPKFALKCTACGYEAKTLVERCPDCGCMKLRPPIEAQKHFLDRADGSTFLDSVNENGQTLRDLCKAFTEMMILYNEGYITCVTGDVVDKDGNLLKSVPLEFIATDPKNVRILYDETGRPGRDYAYTKEDRDTLLSVTKDLDKIDTVSSEGKTLYSAYWMIGENYGATGAYKVYSKDELYHSHWFRQSATYGIPIWLSIEDDLLAIHYMEKRQLKKWECGYVRKLLVLSGFGEDEVEGIADSIHDQLANDSSSIPIICTPPQDPGFGKMDAQLLELGAESSTDLLAEKEEIIRRCLAFIGLPNIFSGDTSESGGMNNESQQITLMDRLLSGMVTNLDELLRWFMGWFPQVTDWYLRVNNPASVAAMNKLVREKLDQAQAMHALGHRVVYRDGEFVFSEYSTEDEQLLGIGPGAQQQPMQPAMDGGNGLPGPDPTGMPPKDRDDRGTTRRENPEQAAAMEDVDTAKERVM